MIFRQLFDSTSGTYTYLLASRRGSEALLIDPVYERVDRYMQLLDELDLKLVKVVDTHVHADHITAMGELRNRTRCVSVMGEEAPVDIVSMRVKDGDEVSIDGLSLKAMHTPGHTNDSYCFAMDDRVFTGDTLLIRGTGRTDFQAGDPVAQYESLFYKLLTLPGDTLVYPGHDYKGDTVSTIWEEKTWNPRLQARSVEDYVSLMNNLNLDNPKMMDVVVPANMKMGLGQRDDSNPEWAVSVAQAGPMLASGDWVLVDLREVGEREKNGVIPGSVHAPYGRLDQFIGAGGTLSEIAASTGRKLLFYCAYGERSAMAVELSHELGLAGACHVIGGIDAWKASGGDITVG